METYAPFPLVGCSKLCLVALNSLLSSLETADDEHRSLMPPQALRNQRDRFKIWAGTLGALQEGRASLDFRLRESTLMQSAVHKLLNQLEDTVKRSIEVVRRVRKPLEELLKLTDEENNSWGESSDESSSDEQNGITTRTELGQNTIAIVQIISDLYKLSFKIRNPATRSSGQSVIKPLLFKQMVYIDGVAVDLLARFEPFDRGHVEETFRELQRSVCGRPRPKDVYPMPDSLADSNANECSLTPAAPDGPVIEPEEELQGFLIDRWSKSLTNRRRYFAYWANHARKLARGDKEEALDQDDSKLLDLIETQVHPTPLPAAAVAAILTTPAATTPSLAGKTVLSETVGSTYERRLDDEIDANSVVSYASTAYDIDGTVADLPRAPSLRPSQTEFQCPYCWVTCPARHAKGKSWREHILRDLQPYMCTYEECPDAHTLYASRQSWMAHEADVHRRVWRCFIHSEPLFTSQDALLQHLRADHGTMLNLAQIQEIAKRSHASTIDGRDRCPFCQSTGPFQRGLANHMAFHMEQFACFAVSRGLGVDDDASSQGGNTNTAHAGLSASSLVSTSLVFSDGSSGDRDFRQDRLAFLENYQPISVTPIFGTLEDGVLSLPVGKIHGINKGSEFIRVLLGPSTIFSVSEVYDLESKAIIVKGFVQDMLQPIQVFPHRWSSEKTLNIIMDPNLERSFQEKVIGHLGNRVASNIQYTEVIELSMNQDPNATQFWIGLKADDSIGISAPKHLLGYHGPVRGWNTSGMTDDERAKESAIALAHLFRFEQIFYLQNESENPAPFEVTIDLQPGATNKNTIELMFHNNDDKELYFAIFILSPGLHVKQLFPTTDTLQAVPAQNMQSISFVLKVHHRLKYQMMIHGELKSDEVDNENNQYRDIVRTVVAKGRNVSLKSLELPDIWNTDQWDGKSTNIMGRDDIIEDFSWWIRDATMPYD